MAVGGPRPSNLVAIHESQAGGVHVGQLRTMETIQYPHRFRMELPIRGKDPEFFQTVNEYSEGPRRLFSMPVKKPRIRFGKDEI